MSFTEFKVVSNHFWDGTTKNILFASAVGGGATAIRTGDAVLELLQIGIAALTFIYLSIKLWRYIRKPGPLEKVGEK